MFMSHYATEVCKCPLRGHEAEELYADYIEGHRSFRDITAEHRNNNIK